MTAHPTNEELAQQINACRIEGAFFLQAARINAHIAVCPRCAKQYDRMLSERENADAMVRLKQRGYAVRNIRNEERTGRKACT